MGTSQTAEMDDQASRATDLARKAREAEQAGDTESAYKLYLEAKAEIEEATAAAEALAAKNPGKGLEYLEDIAQKLNSQAQTIRQEVFSIKMQRMRE